MTGVDGSSNSLSNTHDRELLRIVRSGTDTVVVGSGSVKTEGWHIPQSGKLLVVTGGTFADLPPCPHPERVELLSYQAMRETCNAAGSWLVEGGKALVTSLLEESVIDELCLSIKLDHNVAQNTPTVELPAWMSVASPIDFDLVSLIEDDEMLFTIWRRGTASKWRTAQ
jgi:riboflavin biosynthesis pyrimidine reductase